MPPAARVTDMTSHSPPLNPGPGSLDVIIGGLPWQPGRHHRRIARLAGSAHGHGGSGGRHLECDEFVHDQAANDAG